MFTMSRSGIRSRISLEPTFVVPGTSLAEEFRKGDDQMREMRLNRQFLLIVFLAVGILAWSLLKSTHQQPKPATDSASASMSLSPHISSRSGPVSAYPDQTRTPGAPNPEITQDNIRDTICNPNWSTRFVRPPESYMLRIKKEQMRELGLSGATADYEEDHFISLELGGNPTDPRNLWPEPYGPKPGAKEKDVVENYLHRQVCAGETTLAEAQQAITTDWYRVPAHCVGRVWKP